MKKALSDLASAVVVVLPKAVKTCGGTEEEIQKIVKALMSFDNPASFA